MEEDATDTGLVRMGRESEGEKEVASFPNDLSMTLVILTNLTRSAVGFWLTVEAEKMDDFSISRLRLSTFMYAWDSKKARALSIRPAMTKTKTESNLQTQSSLLPGRLPRSLAIQVMTKNASPAAQDSSL
jgi:hypothetical protein